MLAVNLNLTVRADELEDKIEKKSEIENELTAVENQLNTLSQKLKDLESKLYLTQSDLNNATAQAQALTNQINALEIKINDLSQELAKKATLRDSFIRRLYKENRTPSWEVFFSSAALGELSRTLVYQSLTIADLEEKIKGLNEEITRNEADKNQLAESKTALDAQIARIQALKKEQEKQKANAEAEKNQAASRQNALSSELAEISAEIRALVRAKLAATSEDTSVGDTAPLQEAVPDPPFSPAYAVYSRGYPHRVGLNQYGAYGRAQAGQSAAEIIDAYYDGVKVEDYNCPEKIKVTGSFGVRELNFEDEYLKGIAEMPSSWGDDGMEALKAQAIAARSYALAYTGGGEGSICVTQSCQVWKESKVNAASAQNWHQAVDETKGKVITQDGSPISAWYASTAGGSTRLPSDFDVKWNSSPAYVKRVIDNPTGKLDNWADSYDRESPWFYKAWYDPDVDKHPWLTEEEMQDLFNATLLYSADNDLENDLVQEDPIAFAGHAPGWSQEKVREELEKRDIKPVGTISEITPYDSEEGYTKTVLVFSDNYDKGVEIDGKDFRKVFVMRSPGYLALWSSLYDIVRK